MSTVLSNGVIVPDVGSTNWAADLETNWTLLNALIGAVGANVRLDRPNIWTAAQTFSAGIYGDLDGTAAMAVNDANGNEIATTYALKTVVTALANTVSGKAEDADVVHKAGAETITGNKTWTGWSTFSGNVTFTGTGKIIKGLGTVDITQTSYSENISQGYFSYQDAVTRYFGGFGHRVETDGTSVFIFDNSNFTTGGAQGVVTLRFEYRKDFSYSLCCGGANLGNATRKWKTLNGINPGALSLPANSYVAIDTTNFNKTGGLNTYTSPSDGWVGIQVSSVSYRDDYFVFVGRYTDGSTGNPSYWSQGQVSPLMAHFEGYIGQVFIPVIGGKVYHIRVNGDFSSGGYIRAYFFPCLGNV